MFHQKKPYRKIYPQFECLKNYLNHLKSRISQTCMWFCFKHRFISDIRIPRPINLPIDKSWLGCHIWRLWVFRSRRDASRPPVRSDIWIPAESPSCCCVWLLEEPAGICVSSSLFFHRPSADSVVTGYKHKSGRGGGAYSHEEAPVIVSKVALWWTQ